MCGMILRLDPSRPLVWRSPFSLQIGVDPVAVVLEEVDDGDARVIATLATGATRAALDRSSSSVLMRRPARAGRKDAPTPPTPTTPSSIRAGIRSRAA